MPREKVATSQAFAPFPPYTSRTRAQALFEVSKPCGQYRSPLSREEKIRLFTSGQLGKLDFLENVTHILAPGGPLNWQILLRYLHEKEVITTPSFANDFLNNDLPKFYALYLRTQYDAKKTDGREVNGNGNGHSSSSELAMAKAVGETLERYFLTLYKREDLMRATPDELRQKKVRALDIGQLSSFLPWQEAGNPRFKRGGDSPFYWVRGETTDCTPVYVPAQLVYWSYNSDHDLEEPILAQPTTSAAGAHYTRERAILSGLLEHIQRDGFLMYWLNGITPKRIDVSASENADVKEMLATMERYGLKIYFLDTTSDVRIPSTTCVIIDDRTDEPILAMGGGTGFSVEETIVHAAYETLIVLHHVEQQEGFQMPKKYRAFADASVGHMERLRLWRGTDTLEHASFFLGGDVRTVEDFLGPLQADLPTKERLEYVLTALRAQGVGYEPLIYEVRNEVLTALGYHVVRTIVPALMPLYLNETMAALACERISAVPAKLGYKAADTVNPWPHPFP